MSLEALKRNGHHLELGNFELAGDSGIPIIQPVQFDQPLEWIRFNHAMTATGRSGLGIHFFMDDYLFERVWRDPMRYALFLLEFSAVMTPDFSMYTDYPKAVQVYNHWRKHQLGAYWQSLGMTVIPSVCWSDADSFSWCFDGEPCGGAVAVSSVGTQKQADARAHFLAGYAEMIGRLHPSNVIFYGDVPSACREFDVPMLHIPPYHRSLTHAQKR